MDEDIAFAIRLLANESGIFDEELIQNLIHEGSKQDSDIGNTLANGNTVEDSMENLIETTFYTKFSNIRTHNENSNDILQSINESEDMLNSDTFELINNSRQRLLRLQYNAQQNQLMPVQNSVLTVHNSFAIPQMNSPLYGLYQFGTNELNQINPMNMFGNSQLQQIPNLLQSPFSDLFTNLNNIFQDRVPVVLTEEAINSLPKLSYDELKKKYPDLDVTEQCVICCGKLIDDTEKYTYTNLPCEHKFHTDCIVPYLKDYNHHCPICRETSGQHEAKI